MLIFKTNRLTIRWIEEKDLDDFYDLHGNERVMSLIPTETLSFEASKEEIKKLMKFQADPEANLKVYSIVLDAKEEFIGTCATVKVEEEVFEIGYRFREKFWRQGFGAEIAKGLIDYLFEKTNTQKIVADADPKNIGSVKILSKLMHRRGEIRNEQGEVIDLHFELER
jgi:ribosomal-protein-alanine N-acetyltransferase